MGRGIWDAYVPAVDLGGGQARIELKATRVDRRTLKSSAWPHWIDRRRSNQNYVNLWRQHVENIKKSLAF